MSNLTTIPLTGLSNTVQDLLNQTIDLSGITNTAVLFNDSNTANGSAALTFNKASNTLTVSGNILPGANVTYDLGSADKRFRDLYLANNTVYLGNASISSSGNGIVLPSTVSIGNVQISETGNGINLPSTISIGNAQITESGGGFTLPSTVSIGNAQITSVDGGIQLPSNTTVDGATLASPKIANVQITDSSWNVLDDAALDTAGGYIIINGSGFSSGINVLIGSATATSVTRLSSTQLRVQVPALGSNSYTVYATNPDGGVAIGLNALATSNTPVWSTSSTLAGGIAPFAINVSLAATEGADSITFSNVGVLPAGLTLASNGALTGTLNPASETTYSFVIRATDAENQDANRTFSVTITVPDTFGGTYAGGTANIGIASYGMFYSTDIKAGNNLIINAGVAFSACTFGTMGQFATIVAYNKQGNVAWSKSHMLEYTTGTYNTRSTGYAFNYIGQYFSSTTPGFNQHMAPMVVDSDDNVYFAFNTTYSEGANSSAWIIKYNSAGVKQWVNRLRNSYNNSFPIVSSLALNANNNLIVGMHRASYGNTIVYNSSSMVNQDSVPFLLIANTADGSILKQIDLNVGHIFTAKPIPSTTRLVTGGAYYGYASLGVSNTELLDSYDGLAGKRFYSNTSAGGAHPAIITDVDVHSNGAVFALGSTNNGAFLSVLGYSNTNLNDSTHPSWMKSFANSSGKQWVPGAIKLSNNYVYAIASETGAGFNDSTAYIFRFHAGNGAIDYQKSLTANSFYTGFVGTSLDVKENKLYITGAIEEANTADGRAIKTINLVVPSNGYSSTSGTANIQFNIPGSYGNNKILYLNSSLSVYGSNNLTATDFGGACTFLAYLATATNNMISNTTANSTFALTDTSVHYDGDSTGGYYRAAVISNSTSNVVTLTF